MSDRNNDVTDALYELRGLVAKVLAAQVGETLDLIDEETGEKNTVFTATPATIAAAIKLLKDNDIVGAVQDDKNLSELEEALNKKRDKRSLRLVSGQEE